MKLIELTKGYFAKVDDEDFEELNQFSWRIHPIRNKFFYALRRSLLDEGLGRISVSMHRQITKAPKGMDVDHINHDGLDNRKNNLRICTRTQNQQNTIISRGKSKYKNVGWRLDRNHWRVYLRINTKKKYFGSFDDEVKAAEAADLAALRHFGEYAYMNFPLALEKYRDILYRENSGNSKNEPDGTVEEQGASPL